MVGKNWRKFQFLNFKNFEFLGVSGICIFTSDVFSSFASFDALQF
jgi:hypothetical protein